MNQPIDMTLDALDHLEDYLQDLRDKATSEDETALLDGHLATVADAREAITSLMENRPAN
ncbi:MAG: hypothetical protein ACK4TR_09035 [Phenylobacterium sp.]|uniref:hypothetical protein n=1 Tax=Phenylobacterium sp. TaxID=1871053 RepID=UPI00391B774C